MAGTFTDQAPLLIAAVKVLPPTFNVTVPLARLLVPLITCPAFASVAFSQPSPPNSVLMATVGSVVMPYHHRRSIDRRGIAIRRRDSHARRQRAFRQRGEIGRVKLEC